MSQPPPPLAPDLPSRWMLRADVTFLNHGSFGAVPREVYDAQDAWRRRIEAEPIEILGRRNDALVREVKRPVGGFLDMSPGDFGLVTNATEGVNAYLRSIELKAGDELLTTTHVYNAVRQTMRHVAEDAGATYREVHVPTPVRSAAAVTEAIVGALGPRTRLVLIDHVTSPTALIFPAAEIVQACARRRVDVVVDGAHAPGMIDLRVAALGAAAYAGNLHKWPCAPKGSAFLWVRPDRQGCVHPCTVSHYRGEGFSREFEWQGTRDLSAWLTIPDALAFMGKLGWEKVRRHNHAMAMWAQSLLAERWGVEPLAPLDGSMTGSMATLPLPGRLARMTPDEAKAFMQSMYDEDRIEAPLHFWQDRWHLRVSCQVYNTPEQYERVAGVVLRRAG